MVVTLRRQLLTLFERGSASHLVKGKARHRRIGDAVLLQPLPILQSPTAQHCTELGIPTKNLARELVTILIPNPLHQHALHHADIERLRKTQLLWVKTKDVYVERCFGFISQ